MERTGVRRVAPGQYSTGMPFWASQPASEQSSTTVRAQRSATRCFLKAETLMAMAPPQGCVNIGNA